MTIVVPHFPAMSLLFGDRFSGTSKTNMVCNASVIVTPLLGMTLLGEASTLTVIAGILVAGAAIFTAWELA
jgi:drug/metabolite transporter (DMT)-like permease